MNYITYKNTVLNLHNLIFTIPKDISFDDFFFKWTTLSDIDKSLFMAIVACSDFRDMFSLNEQELLNITTYLRTCDEIEEKCKKAREHQTDALMKKLSKKDVKTE